MPSPGRSFQPARSAAARRTSASRSSSRCRRRSSTGSAPSRWASSSRWDSRAKWLAVAPIPRYEPWRSGESAGWNTIFWLGISYGQPIPAAPEPMFRNSQARHGRRRSGAAADVDDGRRPDVCRLELLGAAPAHLHGLAGVAGEPGRLDRHLAAVLPAEGRPGCGRHHAHVSSGIAELLRQLRRTPKGRCVPVHTVNLPPSHSASAARVSSGTCAM